MLTSRRNKQNHNPLADNGFDSAWNILSPIWDSNPTTYIRHTFEGDMSWVNYRSSFGEIVDRFRWEGGCIVEHVCHPHLLPRAMNTTIHPVHLHASI